MHIQVPLAGARHFLLLLDNLLTGAFLVKDKKSKAPMSHAPLSDLHPFNAHPSSQTMVQSHL